MQFQMIGDYRYGGCIIDGQKYSVIHNGSELLRVRKVYDHRNSQLIWDQSMPMTPEILGILRLARQNNPI